MGGDDYTSRLEEAIRSGNVKKGEKPKPPPPPPKKDDKKSGG